MKELTAAANIVGSFRNKVFGSRVAQEWTLLVILSIDRRSEENTVKAEFLDSQTGETTTFKCFSVDPIFQEGGFVNVKGNEISFLHEPTLTPITFAAGTSISLPEIKVESPNATSPSSPPWKLNGPTRLLPKKHWQEMTEAEMVHYHSDSVSIADLFKVLEPIVKAYARTGVRKPRDVALRLTKDGHKTAIGREWTPRLTQFLLALMFRDEKAYPKNKIERLAAARSTTGSGARPGAGNSQHELGPLSELVRRLSMLGRVVVKRH